MALIPKTIQIFLPDGSARSIKIATITSRVVQAIYIPRNKSEEVGQRNEVKKVGVYFLFGESEDQAKPLVYVGEAEDCYKRIKQHNQAKDFWNIAVVITSKIDGFTRAHGKFLEYHSYRVAKEADRFRLKNSIEPSRPHVSEPVEAELMDNFQTISILLSTLGYPLFEKIAKPAKTHLLVCKGKDAYAEGEYTDDGFVVFKGSKANLEETGSAGAYVRNLRQKLIESGILLRKEKVYFFKEDCIFSAPSAAGAAVLGRRCNGWIEWKDKDGKTLDELKRRIK